MSKVPEVTEAEKHFDCHDPDEGHTTGYFTTVEGHDTLLDTIKNLTRERDEWVERDYADCQKKEAAYDELDSLRSQHERDEAEKLCLARMCVLLKVGGTLAEIEADPDCLNGILEWAQRQAVSDISAREEAGQ